MTPLIKYIWDKFYVFLDIPSDKIWCLILDYLIILFKENGYLNDERFKEIKKELLNV